MWSRSLARVRLLLDAAGQQPGVVWLRRSARGFTEDRCLLQASALTYSTLLAIVPLLALVLALLKAAGFADNLRPFLLERFPVLDPAIVEAVLEYINRANAQAVGGIGLVALLAAAWAMLGNVESSLNSIFGVRTKRGYARRTSEYLAMLLVGTSLIVASFAARTFLESPAMIERMLGPAAAGGATRFGVELLPWVTTWIAFVFLYTWMPNTRVPIGRALLGALLGGTLFQLVQLGYIELQIGFARYHAIYGALAQLPILLVWVYLSWLVVLLGAEGIAAAGALHVEPLGEGALPADLLALAALRDILDAFEAGRPTPRAAELAVRLGVPTDAVHAALAPLLKSGLLVEPEAGHGYLLARSPRAISLGQLVGALGPVRPSS